MLRTSRSYTPDERKIAGSPRCSSGLLDAIERDAYAGTQLPKRLIPRAYHQRYDPIDALWKLDMAGGWRFINALSGRDGEFQAIVIEWFDHGEYERRFSY